MTGVSAEERVIEALARSEGGISTPQAIAAELGLNAKTISNHFTALHKKSHVCGELLILAENISVVQSCESFAYH
jgi:hypothetical protein